MDGAGDFRTLIRVRQDWSNSQHQCELRLPRAKANDGSVSDNEYDGTALIADPIHRYIQFTVPQKKGEVTEKALIDSPWVQRLRYIYQLQSARWVYPSAEHSRFQHSLGAMHLAGEFAKHLYPSLRKVLGDECPSAPFIEEYMRVTGLLHDIGHGPFGHFFDDNFLHQLRSHPRRSRSDDHSKTSGRHHSPTAPQSERPFRRWRRIAP